LRVSLSDCIGRDMPCTCSRKDHVRLVLFYLSLAASDIWMIIRAGRRGVAVNSG